ncbi:MAG: hypothetical protein K0R54_2886 [Clostridiaceae bacterium]|jgi:SLAP domain-containing protein|nr:hypothetical protein [Clostridiaceae bacterium]
MENKCEIFLDLGNDQSLSELKKRVFEEELKEINDKHPLKDNDIDIYVTYFTKNEDDLEAGFFVRNGLSTNLSLEEIPLVIMDDKENPIMSQNFNFKDEGLIKSHGARHFTVNFKIPEGVAFDESKDYSLKFNTSVQMKAFNSVAADIENIPTNLSFEQESALKNFANGLPTLKANEFSVSLFKLEFTPEDDIRCTLLFRNGNAKPVKVEKLPVCIFDGAGTLISRKVFSNASELENINPGKSKVVSFIFKQAEVRPGRFDFAKCRVEFK